MEPTVIASALQRAVLGCLHKSPPPVNQGADSAPSLLDLGSDRNKTGGTDPWIMVSSTKPEDLSSIPGTHMVERGRQLPHAL